jgi:hypothetical protein
MPQRAYYAHEDGAEWGIAVVTTSVKEAKRIAFAAPEINCDWIELRCSWQRNANIDGLPMGVVEDPIDALRRGIYGYLEDATCDICGKTDTCVQSAHGKAVCRDCMENIYDSEAI